MANLLDRMKKTTVIKSSTLLSESDVYKKSISHTPIPMLNLALSGKLDGGLISGVTGIAGESKSFKTMAGLVLVSSYLKENKDAICVFYDSEFGVTPDYLATLDIDASRVLHVPITNVEELKFDAVQKLEEIKRGDKIVFFLDSLGNLASKKEVEDAVDGKSVSDMSRAKQIKSLFRIITPHFASKDIPLIFINHVYQTQEMYAKTIVSGGTGLMYSSDTMLVMKKVQIKDGREVLGYEFGLFVEKSRYIKEKSRLPLVVRYDGGIDPWSGFFDLATDLGYIVSPTRGWYSRAFLDKSTGELVPEEKKWRKADTDNADFWQELLTKTDLAHQIEMKYRLPTISGLENENAPDLITLLNNDTIGKDTIGMNEGDTE